MTEFEINELMKKSLSVKENPPKKLNDRILRQAKERNMRRNNIYRKVMTAVAVAAVSLGVSTTALAAYHVLNASSAAQELGREDLAEPFTNDNIVTGEEKQQGSGYEVKLLGILAGEKVEKNLAEGMNLTEGRTYAAVAISRTDGSMIQKDENLSFFVSPLIQGLDPAFYNLAGMNGSYSSKVMDGVLYYLVDCDDIACFADKEIYLAVLDKVFYDNQAYNFDKDSGKITRREDYQGMNLLFELALDPAMADAQKAADYLQQLESRWNQSAPEDGFEEPDIKDIIGNAGLIEDSVKEVTWDAQGGISYEYSYGIVDGLEDKLRYADSCSPFAEGETGYKAVMWSENMEGRMTYVVMHKDDSGKVTGMVYKDKN